LASTLLIEALEHAAARKVERFLRSWREASKRVN
jgi:hypothetical protein